MSNKFVRSSKFRHVLGTASKKDKCYDSLKISEAPHESNMSSVNCKFLAVVLHSQGGGKFIVLPLQKTGRVDINHPIITGHKGAVTDVTWNPFNDYQIASGSEDCNIMLWDIPDGGLTSNMDECVRKLERHQKRVMHLLWHPSAENILASAGADNLLCVWDTGTGELLMDTDVHPDMIQSISWNYNGSQLVTTCKDKKIRVLDARSGEVLSEGPGHTGNKPSRVVVCGKAGKLFTTGFSRTSDRQYALWDPNDLSKPSTMENIDTSSGVQFPFWDDGTNMVYLVGKGDTQIRLFEVNDKEPYVYFLTMYQSTSTQRAACSMPKKDLDYMKCEVMRFFKVTKTYVEPLSMTVPRKSDMFQSDIFPDCPSGEPALSAEEWASEVDKDPLLVSLGGDAGTTTTKTKAASAAKKRPTVQKQSLTSSAPAVQKPTVTASAPAVASESSSLAGRPDPTTLEEYRKAYTELVTSNFSLYRKAYKELEEENLRLRKKLGMSA